MTLNSPEHELTVAGAKLLMSFVDVPQKKPISAGTELASAKAADRIAPVVPLICNSVWLSVIPGFVLAMGSCPPGSFPDSLHLPEYTTLSSWIIPFVPAIAMSKVILYLHLAFGFEILNV